MASTAKTSNRRRLLTVKTAAPNCADIAVTNVARMRSTITARSVTSFSSFWMSS